MQAPPIHLIARCDTTDLDWGGYDEFGQGRTRDGLGVIWCTLRLEV